MPHLSPARSLRLRLVLAFVAVEFLALLLIAVNNEHLLQKSLLDSTRLRLDEVGLLLNTSTAGLMAQRDYASLQEVLDATRSKEGIVYLVARDIHGRTVAASGWNTADTLPAPEPDPDQDSASPGRFDTVLPLQVAGQPYGTLHYGISLDFLTRARGELVNQNFVIAFAALAASSLLLVALGFWLTRHLARLTKGAEAVADSDFTVRLPVSTQDEVGTLTATFNLMADAVRARVEALQRSEADVRRYLTASEQEHARLTALLSAMNEGILFVSAEDRVLYYNPSFLRIWMINSAESLIGKPIDEVLNRSANMLSRPDRLSKHILRVEGTHEMSDSVEIHMADGRLVMQVTHPVRDTDNRLIGRLWIYEDVTRERQTAEQLIYLAERDSLTGLINRHRFQDELERMSADAKRRNTTGALLLFDLDEFKYINDTFGHSAGDAVLIRVAGEVGGLVRGNEVFSRLGGDEFAILALDVTESQVAELGERITRAVSHIPFHFHGQNLRLTTSVGIALYPQHAMGTEDLIAHADTAMYQAKESGKNTWRIYRPELDDRRSAVNRLSWNDRISRALENDLLQLHFQGVFHTDRTLSHLEALVRLTDENDPDKLIMPGHFIPFAEKSGRICEIDRWVIEAAIRVLSGSASIPSIAVNISGRSFDDPTLPQYITEKLQTYGVSPKRLLVELTETSAVTDLHDAQRFIESLHQTGCPVCLDDFGTGFSSFAYLKHLDADILKIDGLFIRNLIEDHDNQVFVKAIVDVARGMNKTTVAEFVEDEEILAMLRTFGVDLVQGYHLDMPQGRHPAVFGHLPDGIPPRR